MPAELHLASLLVHARPEALADVSRRIEEHGCEIHGTSNAGKLVVTLESDSERHLSEVLTKLQLLQDVLAATLVFHHVETADGGPTRCAPDAIKSPASEDRS